VGHANTNILKAQALQQPDWPDPAQVGLVREALRSRPPLVRLSDVLLLRSILSRVAAGEVLVLQAGDCAEDSEECTSEHVRRKAAMLNSLAGDLAAITCKPVIRVGRIAGQFAKPRTNELEHVADGAVLPAYRGHMVNRPEPDPESRRPDPLRILTGYMAASEIMIRLGWPGPAVSLPPPPPGQLLWTSHEALLLDYELPMIRETSRGARWLGSTHWPWTGERTRQPDGAHVSVLAGVCNPVACKVGPGICPDEIIALCKRLDPQREPGRLTFIVRMGADLVRDRLPPLIGAVRSAGHPVIWLTDPMHGNTIAAPDGGKIRLVETIMREVRNFHRAVSDAGGIAGGLHLEATPDDVTECVMNASSVDREIRQSTSLCDPRLNLRQATAVVFEWANSTVGQR
jgi:3-deoxy-7-phosphoheptulonate synthase